MSKGKKFSKLTPRRCSDIGKMIGRKKTKIKIGEREEGKK